MCAGEVKARTYLRHLRALGPAADADAQGLAGQQLFDADAAQRFDVDEDAGGAFAAGDEAVALQR